MEYCTKINILKETKGRIKGKKNMLSLVPDVDVEKPMPFLLTS